MFRKLPIVVIALAGCSAAFAHQHTHSDAGGAYAIENPLRPGAKAPYCQTQDETADGCTFHSVAGETYSAHLLAGEGETWVAATPDTQTINFETQPRPSVLEGKSYQVIKVVPSPARNADTTVTFDKLTGKGEQAKVVERRRITVMVHPR